MPRLTGLRRLLRLVALGAICSVVGTPASTDVQDSRETLGKKENGSYLVPTNQIVGPVGVASLTQFSRPKDVALSPSGERAAVLCTGRLVVASRTGEVLATVDLGAAALGVCWAPDGSEVYASAPDGKISVVGQVDETWKVLRSIPVDVASPGGREASGRRGNPQVVGLAISSDGRKLYAALGIRNAVVEVDVPTGKVVRQFAVDAAPYQVLLAERAGKLFVANRGGEPAKQGERSADSAGTSIVTDSTSDGPARGSVSIVDLATGQVRSVTTGKQPGGMAYDAASGRLFVAESDADSVGIVDVAKAVRVDGVPLGPAEDPGFGMLPTDVALSADGKTLYAACGGANAVAAISVDFKPTVLGFIPSGWFPIAIAADDKGLVVACSKGVGARPESKTTRFGVHDNVGLIQFATLSEVSDLPRLTGDVVRNNRWAAELPARKGMEAVPVPERIGEPSVFKHVVYIIKENLTYDNVLGDMPEGNGDANLCIFGGDVSPNHHRLAREFVLLDNTYTSGTNSADGHQWTSSSMCNAYQEQNYGANQRSYPYDGGDPLACSPKGFLWTAVHRRGLSVRVYGEYVNNPKVVDRETGKTPGFFDFWADYKKGGNRYRVTAETDNAALRPFLHPRYIGFPSIVPDQWRADRFLEDFEKFEKSDSLPSLCMLLLPNNHTSGISPSVPTPRAMVADNDLALGRIVDAISHSKYWKDTLILVIEDDSQNGLDHVDGHRTAAFCISAYTRRHAVVSLPYNHTSVIRTIELVLGVPSMTRFDQSATPLTACFVPERNLAAYYHAPNLIPLDERNKPRAALNLEGRRILALCERQDWSNYDVADPLVVSMASWVSQRPGVPFPKSKFHAHLDEDD